MSDNHLLLSQDQDTSRSDVMSGCQSTALSPQLPPLVGLPQSVLLGPAHTDVLPAASGEVQRQRRHLGTKVEMHL